MQEEFCRTEQLLGAEAMERLQKARVAVFGIGGVGGYVAEALARSGVGALDLVDRDVVSESNLNRQIIALHSTLGRSKAEVMRERILDIHPEIQVRAWNLFYLPETADQFDLSRYDYLVDAMDTVTAKLELIQRAQAAGVPVISCMGAGNKLDPSQFRTADIGETWGCPLARVMRRELRKRGILRLQVVFSPEPPRKTQGASVPGSVAFVPSVAGLVAAGAVIRELAGLTEVSPAYIMKRTPREPGRP